MDRDIFTQLVDAYYASLYRFAYSLARSQEDACDLTQQTFYIWATKGTSLRDSTKAKTWLFTTLYREFLKSRRRGGRMMALEDLPPGKSDPPEPEVDLVARLDGEQVMELLQGVDEVFRVPLTLFYQEDMSYQEIAILLEVPLGTVMSRLSRGKAQLRVLLSRGENTSHRVVPFPKTQEGAQ